MRRHFGQLPLARGSDGFQQRAFVGCAARRLGMIARPNGQLFDRQRLIIFFDHRFGQTELQIFVEPLIHHLAADVVVVVSKLQHRLGHHLIASAEQAIDLLQLRQALGIDLLGPVVGGRHAQGSRRDQGGHLDIASVDAQQRRILAGAAPLHARRDHYGRKRHGWPRIDGTQDKRLRAAAARAGHANPLRIDVGQLAEPVESPQRVVRLQAEHALHSQLGLRAEEAPILGRVKLGRCVA